MGPEGHSVLADAQRRENVSCRSIHRKNLLFVVFHRLSSILVNRVIDRDPMRYSSGDGECSDWKREFIFGNEICIQYTVINELNCTRPGCLFHH